MYGENATTALWHRSESDLGAAFLGFTVGAVLFGITILQAFTYFLNYASDKRSRKQFIIYLCFLDILHFVFSVYMVYCMLVTPRNNPVSGSPVLWSFKVVGTTQTIVVISIQSFYLGQIWSLSKIHTINRTLSRFVKVSVLTVLLYSLAVGVVFLMHLEKVTTILSFSGDFQYIVYLGLGSTASVDCGIAGMMSFTLRQSSRTTSKRGIGLIKYLVLYFIGTGFLTAVAAVLALSLYIVRPNTLLYLSVEFSIIRLYVNAILALFNSKSRLQQKMNETVELRMSSILLFGDGMDSSEEAIEV